VDEIVQSEWTLILEDKFPLNSNATLQGNERKERLIARRKWDCNF
jgi:hypothetical protein